MAASPRWKVYTRDGEYIAATKHVEDTAAVVACHGDGATIRDGHNLVVFTKNGEVDSFDRVVEIVDVVVRSYCIEKGMGRLMDGRWVHRKWVTREVGNSSVERKSVVVAVDPKTGEEEVISS